MRACRSTSAILTAHGSAALTRIPTGCYASTSQKAPISACTAPRRLEPWRPLSTPGPERRLIAKRLQRRLTSCFYRSTKTVLRRPFESALNAPIRMVDQACTGPLRRDGHPQGCQRQVGAQVIAHCPADDLSAVEVQDRGQIKPALIGLDISNICEPDPVRRSGGEVAVEQVRGDREVVPAIGRPHPPGPCHDGANAVMAHQPLDAATAHPAALGLQLGMDTRTAVASVCVAMDPPDVVDEVTIGDGSSALRA